MFREVLLKLRLELLSTNDSSMILCIFFPLEPNHQQQLEPENTSMGNWLLDEATQLKSVTIEDYWSKSWKKVINVSPFIFIKSSSSFPSNLFMQMISRHLCLLLSRLLFDPSEFCSFHFFTSTTITLLIMSSCRQLVKIYLINEETQYKSACVTILLPDVWFSFQCWTKLLFKCNLGCYTFFSSNKKYSWTTIFQTNPLLYFKYFFSLYFDELSDLIWGRSVNDMKTSLSPLSLLLSSFFPAFGKHPNRWQRLCLHLSCKLSLQEIESNLSRQTSKSLTL